MIGKYFFLRFAFSLVNVTRIPYKAYIYSVPKMKMVSIKYLNISVVG